MMKSIFSIIGLVIAVVFFVLSIYWAPTEIYISGHSTKYWLASSFTACTLVFPFLYGVVASGWARSLPMILGGVFSAIAAFFTLIAFFFAAMGMRFEFFWTAELILWGLTAVVILFAFLSAGADKSNM
jgi:hypothetical protein